MADKVLNIKVCSPLKLHSGLTGNYHANCHYSYNLPLPTSKRNETRMTNLLQENKNRQPNAQIAHLVFADTKKPTSKIKRSISSLRL